MKFINVTLLILFFSSSLFSQESMGDVEKKIYTTQKTSNISVELDGIPNEAAWEAVEWAGDFKQFRPNEGKPESQLTTFKVLYDDKFLYAAFRLYDSAPDSIEQRMGRRDQFSGDVVEIIIDSYHDLRSAFSFSVSASGVRGDTFVSNNGEDWDENWNPIWTAKTNIDTEGWTAEMKIPLSQLRFDKAKDKIWGLNVTRFLFREQQRSMWQMIHSSSGVWVSGFGELHGLQDVKAQKQIEIAPYTVGKIELSEKEEGNPFATGQKQKITAGVDGKVAVTSDLMLDFTINPDFGQVEADPSRVRIDGFQNFYEERRPFFIENRNIFNYEITGSQSGGNYDSDLLFYSRRIGSSPSGSPDLNENEYADVPQNTSILGAAKFSGKTKNGLSIGILESLTQEEVATIDSEGQERSEIVEPLSNYFVSRIQKDFNEGQTIIGGIITSVNRKGNLNGLLHDNAYSGGVDFQHFWDNRKWYVVGNAIFSHVNGTKEKILNTQTSFQHLFQRPNASEVNVDSNRTSLTGTGGTFRFGKSAGTPGKNGRILRFDTGLTYRSPELEINDIGFMQTANEINHFTWVGLQYPNAFSIFRSARINYSHNFKWDFGGQFLDQSFETNGRVSFKNFWSAGMGLNLNTYDVSNTALRGGSSLRKNGGFGEWFYVSTDRRKKVRAFVNYSFFRGNQKAVTFSSLRMSLSAQPMDALSASISVGYNKYFREQDQFVSTQTFNGETRNIVSGVNQNTLRYTLRINYNITPDLTLQYYGQPYTTQPVYKDFAFVTDPLNKTFENRFHRYTADQISESNGEFKIDENGDGITDYSFSNPDFNFVQFRSNFVARWEYKAGSEIYFVWSQGSTPDDENGFDKSLNENIFGSMFGQTTKNIFLLKWTYRFLR